MPLVLKFLHLAAMLSAVGLLFFVYVHFVRAVSSDSLDPMMLRHLHRSFDTALAMCWMVVLTCGVLLVYPKGYRMNTPWIEAAFWLMGSTLLLWFASLLCKYRVLDSLIKNQRRRIELWSSYHVSHLGMLILLVVIARDAITKTTWLIH